MQAATSQHQYKPKKKANQTIFLEENFGVHIKKGSMICATMTRACSPRSWCKETLNFSPPKRGDEWRGSKLILIHTAKERISEDVVGIVVFASVSSRSTDRDPIWTPCDRSCYGTCQIWPRHLAKLHAPRKTWKTPYRNYTRDLGTQNC